MSSLAVYLFSFSPHNSTPGEYEETGPALWFHKRLFTDHEVDYLVIVLNF